MNTIPNKPQENITDKPLPTNEDEIDLIALAKTLWNGRKTVIRFLSAGLVLGLVFALLSPKEYTVTTPRLAARAVNWAVCRRWLPWRGLTSTAEVHLMRCRHSSIRRF